MVSALRETEKFRQMVGHLDANNVHSLDSNTPIGIPEEIVKIAMVMHVWAASALPFHLKATQRGRVMAPMWPKCQAERREFGIASSIRMAAVI